MRRDDPRRTASSPRNIKDYTAQMRGGAASKKRLTAKAPYKSGPFPPPALPGLNGTTTLSDSRRGRRSWRRRGRYPRLRRVSPDYPNHPSNVLCPLPRQIERVLVSIASPFIRPSPNGRPGRHPHCRLSRPAQASLTLWPTRIAGPPEATFVTRLRPCRLPVQAARQLPDQSTTLWAESSSTDDSRLRGARPIGDIQTNVIRSLRRRAR